MLLEELKDHIEALAQRYKYRPLPKKIRSETHQLYKQHLNGFKQNRPLSISGQTMAVSFNRVVTGDYGAYVEIDPKDLHVTLKVEKGQGWRLNEQYLNERGLSIKYHWYHFLGRKVYWQLAPVKYADYRPGMIYVSVLDFDPL